MKKLKAKINTWKVVVKGSAMQSIFGRMILRGKFYLIKPKIWHVGMYWTDEPSAEQYGDKILRVEEYPKWRNKSWGSLKKWLKL